MNRCFHTKLYYVDKLLHGSVLFATIAIVFTILIQSATAQVYGGIPASKLPPNNRRLLDDLRKKTNGISENWDRAIHRDAPASVGFPDVFSESEDRIAWRTLSQHLNQNEASNEWKKYWELVWSSSEMPHESFQTRLKKSQGGQASKITFHLSKIGKIADEQPDIRFRPMPGDVVKIAGETQDILAVWWGDRSFPSWKGKKKVSFFFYTYEPYKNRFANVNAISFNSYPPRITRNLYARLYKPFLEKLPKNDVRRKLKPNNKLFGPGKGYCSIPFKSAYAKFYMPVSPNWYNSAKSFAIYRRRAESEFERLWKIYDTELENNWKRSNLVNGKPYRSHVNNCAIVLSPTLNQSKLDWIKNSASRNYQHWSVRLTANSTLLRMGSGFFQRAEELAISLAEEKTPDYIVLVKEKNKPSAMVYSDKAIAQRYFSYTSVQKISFAEFKKLQLTGIAYFHRPYSDADHIDLWDGRKSQGQRVAIRRKVDGAFLDSYNTPVEPSQYILFWQVD